MSLRERIVVFAVEDDRAQITWASLPPGTHTFTAGPSTAEVEVAEPATPGAVDVTGLAPDTTYTLTLNGRRVHRFRTLPPPPGELLFRFATVNDCHIGERAFGFLRTIRETETHDEPYPTRCLRAAIAEAKEWGAQHLVVKGDLTNLNRATELETGGRLLRESGLDVSAVLGNHDVTRRGINARQALAGHGIEIDPKPRALDLPGLRLVLVQSARRGFSRGFLDDVQVQGAAELIAASPHPVFLVLHHPLQRIERNLVWPPGVPGSEAGPFLEAVAAASPNVVIASGHSHRNRFRKVGPIPLVQTGSTKDFPGAWTGYAVHVGGIRQVVRRTARPDVMRWTDQSRRAVFGAWPLWSSGLRSWRCFTHPWPHPGQASPLR